MIQPRESLGSAKLVAALDRDPELRRQIAYDCRVSEQTVRNWCSGTSPRACYRDTLRRLAGTEYNDWEAPAPKRRVRKAA